MKFATTYNPAPVIHQSFDGMQQLYKEVLSDSGAVIVEPDGFKDMNEVVAAYADVTDIYKILDKYQLTGDESLLNKSKGFYGDISNLPTSYIEMHNLLSNVQRNFENLPVEIRNKFNSPVMLMEAMQNGEFDSFVRSLNNKDVSDDVKEVVDNEQEQA